MGHIPYTWGTIAYSLPDMVTFGKRILNTSTIIKVEYRTK